MLKEIFSPAKASAFAGAGAESVDEVTGLASGGFGVSDGLLASLQEARKSIGITTSKALFLIPAPHGSRVPWLKDSGLSFTPVI